MLESPNSSGDATPPNFRTSMDPRALLSGLARTAATIYDPEKFYERAWRSVEQWNAQKCQRPPWQPSFFGILAILARSVWHQGLRSSYRRAYWKYFLKMLVRCGLNRSKFWLAGTLMISGHHFIPYATELAEKIVMEREILETKTLREAITADAGK